MAKGITGTIWFLEVYEDDENYRKYVENVEGQFDWVKIRHDKDVNPETGELKKPHVHYLITTTNTASLSTISYRTGIPENYVKVRSSYRHSFRYLLHLDQPEKFQYSEEELEGVDVKGKLAKYVGKDSDSCVMEIIDLINLYRLERKPYACLVKAVVERGLWGYFRQAQATFRQLWEEALDWGYYSTPKDEVQSDEEF